MKTKTAEFEMNSAASANLGTTRGSSVSPTNHEYAVDRTGTGSGERGEVVPDNRLQPGGLRHPARQILDLVPPYFESAGLGLEPNNPYGGRGPRD